MPQRTTRACVVVMGDIGRSPRMQHHALSLADAGMSVDVVAYGGTPALPRLIAHPSVRLHLLPVPVLDHVRPRSAARRLLTLMGRGWWFLRRLFAIERPHMLLVQVPPSLPVVALAAATVRLRGAGLVLDWHNLGDSVLALDFGPRHPAVRALRWWERRAGRWADLHVCASEAMGHLLARERRITEAVVLPDLPPSHFVPLGAEDRARARHDLAAWVGAGLTDGARLVVSPTGWTRDEDMGILIEAARGFERRLAQSTSFPVPELIVAVTGRGPYRKAFEERVAGAGLRQGLLRTLWLPPDRYPFLLAAADLGLCFHRSASGADLPIKLADMLGCGLPVCVLDHGDALSERLEHGRNALLFRDEEELASQLWSLLGAEGGSERLAGLRKGVEARPLPRWEGAWRETVLPSLHRLLAGSIASAAASHHAHPA